MCTFSLWILALSYLYHFCNFPRNHPHLPFPKATATTSTQSFVFYLQQPPHFSWLESLPVQFIQYDVIRSIFFNEQLIAPQLFFVYLQVQILWFDYHPYLGALQLNLYFPVPKTKPLLNNDPQAGSWLCDLVAPIAWNAFPPSLL